MTSPTLTRRLRDLTTPPARILHLGIGNFTRAHQAWYTAHASDAAEWGIAAFTGRSATMADALAPQDGLYTLITKGPEGDTYEVVDSLCAVHPASDLDAMLGYFASPQLAVVTSTVTEAGYYRAGDGSLDVTNDAVAGDLETLRGLAEAGALGRESLSRAELATAPVKIVAGLLVRREAAAGALTILPCDNIPDNGTAFAQVVTDAAREIDASLVEWMSDHVAWATCMVDRITPATTDDDRAAVARTQGYEDAAPVPTEPFHEWVIAGTFPAGRPDWESAGARIVDDVEPYEQRKLWMLNGSHSLMAYAGPILGVETVDDAIRTPLIRRWVEEWWAEAGSGLSIEWREYARALVERYENPNIRHLLTQIAHDGSQKMPVRIAPTLRAVWGGNAAASASANAETADAPATPGAGAARAVAAWMLHLRGEGCDVHDAAAETVKDLVGADLRTDAQATLAYVAPDLANAPNAQRLVETIVECAHEILAAR